MVEPREKGWVRRIVTNRIQKPSSPRWRWLLLPLHLPPQIQPRRKQPQTQTQRR